MQIRVAIDEQGIFGRTLTELERDQLPYAAMAAANETGFAVREQWAAAMPQVFDRPTPLTQKAVLIRKATKQTGAAEIYIRDEASKGTPPAKYLQAQVAGGERRLKGSEKRLQAGGFLPAGSFAVPGAGAELDAYGNIPGSQMNRILSQLGARFDPYQNETETSRDRRHRREVKKGERRSDYFALRQARGRLAPGVYQRVITGFGSAVRSILRFVSRATYQPRFHIFELAERLYRARYPFEFNRALGKAVETARLRSGR
jgi:hypothetical protein